MKDLNFVINHTNINDAPISMLHISGRLTSKNLIGLGKEYTQIFHMNPSKIIVDLSNLEKLDIGGISYLIKLSIMAANLGILTTIKVPDKYDILYKFKKTKIENLLNVEYIIPHSFFI